MSINLEDLRTRIRLAEADGDEETKPFATVAARVEIVRAQYERKRDELRESGKYTDAGVSEQLKPLRDAWDKERAKLRETVLEPKANAWLSALTPEPPPTGSAEQDQRLVTWFNGLHGISRTTALAKAFSGQDADLAGALLRNQRFVSLAANSWNLLRSTFAKDADITKKRLQVAAATERLLSKPLEY